MTLAMLCPAPARAGHYVISLSATLPGNGRVSPCFRVLVPLIYTYGGSGASGTVTVQATAKWTPDGLGDTSAPPASQTFLEEMSVQGSAAGTANAGAVASDGASDPSIPTQNPIYSNGVEIQDVVTALSVGEHLTTRSGSVITLPARTLTITYFGATGNFGLCYGVGTDSRAINISCPSIEPNHGKGYNHIRASDGSMQADSVAVAWGNPTPHWYIASPVGGGVMFNANASSFQQPFYTWNVTGGTIVNPIMTPVGVEVTQSSIPLNLDFGPATSGSQGPVGTSAVTVSVRDNYDQAVGTNTYWVTWHQPVEYWQRNGSYFEIAPTPFPSSSPDQPADGQVNIPVGDGQIDLSAGAHFVGGAITFGATLVSLTAPETDPVLLSLAQAGGYTLGLAAPPSPTIYTEYGSLSAFTTSVGEQLNIHSGNTSGVFQPTINRMDSRFALELGDGYGPDGYTGPAPGYIQWPTSIAYIYFWKWAGTTGTPTVGTGGSSNG